MIRIAVIGESCIDQYVYGTCDRVCPEAAALCFKHNEDITFNPGMAGNVYQNLLALNTNHNIELITTRSNIIKKRFVDKKYNTIVFREDINDVCEPIDIDGYDFSNYDVIVFSDYCKGFLSVDDISKICSQKKESCVTFLDTKKSVCSILTQAVDYIKINSNEFKQNVTDATSIKHCSLIVTEGEDGASLYQNGSKRQFPTDKVILRDVCGAGDTFLAALVIAYVQHANIENAIMFANQCASKVVGQFGVVTP
jgi:D-beta-D-heptose 7-phosphate kinase/D-beta-D-heptose 1-phosphate adenosyltransferase